MNMYGGVEVQLHIFLVRQPLYYQKNNPVISRIAGCVSLRAGLDQAAKREVPIAPAEIELWSFIPQCCSLLTEGSRLHYQILFKTEFYIQGQIISVLQSQNSFIFTPQFPTIHIMFAAVVEICENTQLRVTGAKNCRESTSFINVKLFTTSRTSEESFGQCVMSIL